MPRCNQCVAGLLKLSRRHCKVPNLGDRQGEDVLTSTQPDPAPATSPRASLAIFGACLEKAAADGSAYRVRWPSSSLLDSESSASEDEGMAPQISSLRPELRLQRAERFHIGAVPECFQISSEPENPDDLRERERRLALRRLNVPQRLKRLQRGCRAHVGPRRCRSSIANGLAYNMSLRGSCGGSESCAGQNSSTTDEEVVRLPPLAAFGVCQRQPTAQCLEAGGGDNAMETLEDANRAVFRFQEVRKECIARDFEKKLGRQCLSSSFCAWRQAIASERQECLCAARWALRGSLQEALRRAHAREHAAKTTQGQTQQVHQRTEVCTAKEIVLTHAHDLDLRSFMECAWQQPLKEAAALHEVIKPVQAVDVVNEPKEAVMESANEAEANSSGLEPRSGDEENSDAHFRRQCTFEELTNPQIWRKLDLNPAEREMHLCDQSFDDLFGMSKDAFRLLPKWRRHSLKKRHGLF